MILYLSFYVRYGKGATSAIIINKFVMYGLGHVPCFDYGFSKFEKTLFGDTHGYYTFNSLANILNINEINSQKLSVFNIITEYGDTNVRTEFGDILMDYGLIGSAIFMSLFGNVAGIIYTSAVQTKSSIFIMLLAMIYFSICYSFLISPFRYDTIIVAFVCFGLMVFLSRKVEVKNE